MENLAVTIRSQDVRMAAIEDRLSRVERRLGLNESDQRGFNPPQSGRQNDERSDDWQSENSGQQNDEYSDDSSEEQNDTATDGYAERDGARGGSYAGY